jgi:tRNA (guanine10-N2)-dimethyltransferase
MKLFRISQKNTALSIAEIDAQYSIADVHGEFVFVKKAKPAALAYTKETYDLLFETTINRLLKTIKTYNWNKKIKKTYCVRSHIFEKEIASAIWHRLKKPTVDLENPVHLIHFFFIGKKVYCGILEWKNDNAFLQRKAHLRPELYPASLDPQLALAMVNLARGKKIVDPFCGTGGILIEGAFAGRKMIGYDISKWMLDKCRKNLQNYQLNIKIEVGDATTFVKKCDAIVTELPFGKNTKSQDLVRLYTAFLLNAKKNTKKMVVSFPDFIDYKKLLKKTGWKTENDFTIYMHASLSKHVVVMKR